MRTLIHAAVLAGFVLPVAGFAGAASAADLDPYYEPEGPPQVEVAPPPVAVLPPPQVPIAIAPPLCGPYRPCFRPYARFGSFGPRPYRFYRQPAYVNEKPAYAPIGREGYGYDYDRERFERSHAHASRFGYDEPQRYPDVRRNYERRERVERYDGGRPRADRPYADPLGHGADRPRGERFGGDDRRQDERRYGGPRDERFDRGPGPDRDERGPYSRG